VVLIALSAPLSLTSTSAADEWDDFHITIDPSSPTDEEIFDLHAFRWFPDSGYVGLDQSIRVTGNQIDLWALVQDQHTQPDSAFLTVMTRGGAFFDDFGPLAAGTYHFNAEIWLTPWPETSGGSLYDTGQLQFTVSNTSPHQPFPGDFNGDNAVDAGDYVAWRKSPDALVEEQNTWRARFGQIAGNSVAPESPSEIAVPEPNELLLLAAGVMLPGVVAGGGRRRSCAPCRSTRSA
jgi:hypothetical protein